MPQTHETRRAGARLGSGTRHFLSKIDGPKLSPNRGAKQAIDFERINRAALAVLPAVLRRLLPDGRIIGGEWVARNPTRADRHLGSFKINIRTGRWADFATGDKGGDPVSLFAYVERCRQSDAAIWLAQMLGMNGEHRRHG
jgi:hypothetical protein